MSKDNEYQKLLDEIEKVKFHNRSLLTLIGTINEDKMEETTIYEATVMFDLSKQDLRELKILIENYTGNNFAFEQKALKINPAFKKNNLIFILKAFLNTSMFEEKISLILQNYDSN